LLEGQDWSTTVVQWNAHTAVVPGEAVPTDTEIATAAFVVSADNFIAHSITFQVRVTIFSNATLNL
jgi:hypothetical protein